MNNREAGAFGVALAGTAEQFFGLEILVGHGRHTSQD
jgi:hypothetical protein